MPPCPRRSPRPAPIPPPVPLAAFLVLGLVLGSARPALAQTVATETVAAAPATGDAADSGEWGIGSYRLGQGLDVGPVNLAGYSSLVMAVPDQGRKAVALEDLSLYASAHLGSLINPFAEAELTGVNLGRWGRGSGAGGGASGLPQDRDGYVVLERLYNDTYLPGGFTLRLGKMLAPVGEWNQIHAAPLVLSTVRPAATNRNFSEYATGLSLLYSDAQAELPDVQVYWQPMEEFSARPDSIVDDHYRLVEGVHISLPLTLLDKIGLSLQRNIDAKGVEQHLYGADFHYTLGRLTLRTEWNYSTLSTPAALRTQASPPTSEWGGFVAPSYALDDHWSVYSWYEIYAGRAAAANTTNAANAQDVLMGVAYRPHPAMVVKIEYVQNVGGPPVNPTGLFASWSVLF